MIQCQIFLIASSLPWLQFRRRIALIPHPIQTLMVPVSTLPTLLVRPCILTSRLVHLCRCCSHSNSKKYKTGHTMENTQSKNQYSQGSIRNSLTCIWISSLCWPNEHFFSRPRHSLLYHTNRICFKRQPPQCALLLLLCLRWRKYNVDNRVHNLTTWETSAG